MIVSLQRKFILISAISIFVVFSGIFLVLVFFSNRQLDRTMDTLADAISFNDGVFPEFDPAQPSQPFPYDNIITEETRFSTRFFTVWVDDAGRITRINIDSVSSISEEQVEDFAQTALSEGTRRGWVSDYRYRVVETGGGSTLVFVNGTMNRSMSGRLLLTAFLVLLGSAFLILALIIIISKRVVHPVAESYEKQKQFITDANHELKTPLTLILSNLDIVEADVGKNEWLDDIRSESERMGLLINQMVTLCRMDESDTPLALADVDLIHQVVYNLIDNAVKFVNDGGYIEFSYDVQDDLTYIGVKNSGAGLSKEEVAHVFDRFYKTDKSRSMDKTGVGLGLSIVRTVINMHSGEIIVRSVEGEYCEFQFTLKTANARNSQNLLKNEKEKNRPQGE